MHSAVFVAKLTEKRTDWQEFAANADTKVGKDRDVSRLAENVWLVNFHASPAALGWLTTLCEQRGMTYGILQLEDAPQWLPLGFDPKTI
jgi:hypothetical protein